MDVDHPCKIAYYNEHGTNEPNLNDLHQNILNIESSIRNGLKRPRKNDRYEVSINFGDGFTSIKMTLNDISINEVRSYQETIINRGS